MELEGIQQNFESNLTNENTLLFLAFLFLINQFQRRKMDEGFQKRRNYKLKSSGANTVYLSALKLQLLYPLKVDYQYMQQFNQYNILVVFTICLN